MTAITHRRFSIGFAYIAIVLLYSLGHSLVNYYLAIPIMLSASHYGAKLADVDHNWDSVKDKTVSNKIINTLIHLTGGKHRSWQTHSWDIIILVTIASIFVPELLLHYGKITAINKEVASLLFIGVSCGWISHGIADMMTSAGMRITCLSKVKVAFVPKQFKFWYTLWLIIPLLGLGVWAYFKFGIILAAIDLALILTVLILGKKLKGFRFNTGEDWEAFVYKCTAVTNFCLGLLCLIYPLINKNIFGINIIETLISILNTQ